MLSKEMYTDEYIRKLQRRTGNDPALLERVVYALGLLEAISSVGWTFDQGLHSITSFLQSEFFKLVPNEQVCKMYFAEWSSEKWMASGSNPADITIAANESHDQGKFYEDGTA